MTQTTPPEQVHKMRYPKGCRMLLVRDCTVAICNNVNSGATLLSTLLFWYEHPHKFDTYEGDDFILCRTQEEIVAQSCNQIDVKTIHDAAVPLLQLFGYLSIKEKMNGNIYTLHLDRILAAYAAYEGGEKKLRKFLKEALAQKQLEFSPIVMNDVQLEKTLINKRYFQLELEKVLIANRENSNCKRGRKPKSEAVQEAETQPTETIETIRENKGKEREEVADATAHSQSSQENMFSDDDTEKKEVVDGYEHNDSDSSYHHRFSDIHVPDRMANEQRLVTPSQKDQRDARTPADTPPSRPTVDDADRSAGSGNQRATDTNKVGHPPAPRKPRANKVNVPPHQRQHGLMDTLPEPESIPEKALAIMDKWDAIHRKPAPRTPKTIQAAQLLMVYDPSEDELRECEKWLYTTDRPGKPWYRSHGVHLPDIAEKIGSWQSLQNAPPPKPEKEPSNEHRVSSFGTPGYNFSDEFYPSEAEKKAYYAAHPIGGTRS